MRVNKQIKCTVAVCLLLVISACGGGGGGGGGPTTQPGGTVRPSNSAPVADAGINQSVNTSQIVTLSGANSSDADGDVLNYSWTILDSPVNSNVTLSGNSIVNPTFTADVSGDYIFGLVVNDGTVNSPVDQVTVTASVVNLAPNANAGVDQNTVDGLLITLDGSLSSDPNGDMITYAWLLTAAPTGSTATLSDTSIVNPTFTADTVGTFMFDLVVSDGALVSATDSITVTVTQSNAVPVANAGTNQNVLSGSTVNLSGAGSSDANGDILSYRWTLVSQPATSDVVIADADTISPLFTPSVDGSYVLQLIVNDGTVNSTADTVMITAAAVVVPINNAPIANAGIDQNVNTSQLVSLSGVNSSDTDGDALIYVWTILDFPTNSNVTLSDNSLVNPTFTADVSGDYIFGLIVNDGAINSIVDQVTVTASELNLAPSANAGVDQNTVDGLLITLDGSLSSDPNGDMITYAWLLTAAPTGSTATLSNTSIVNPTFTADTVGTFMFDLVVSDGVLSSAADSITVTVTQSNAAPIANAGTDQNVFTSSLVSFSGAGSSDANGDTLSYRWSVLSQPATSDVTITAADTLSPSFTPIVDGSYVLQLIVNDGTVDSSPDTIMITVQTANSVPVANAGTDQSLLVGQLVSLSGASSIDADNDAITYLWSFVSIPDTSTVTLDNAAIVNPQFTPDVEGSYVLNLTVNDGQDDSVVDAVVIDVILPQIKLQRVSRGVNPAYEDVPFPFDNQLATITASINSANPPNFYVVDRFKLISVGQAYTITNISVGASIQGFTAFFQDLQTGFVLTEGTTIPADTEFEFAIGALFTDGAAINLRFTFEIAETNEKFDITYNYTTIFI